MLSEKEREREPHREAHSSDTQAAAAAAVLWSLLKGLHWEMVIYCIALL